MELLTKRAGKAGIAVVDLQDELGPERARIAEQYAALDGRIEASLSSVEVAREQLESCRASPRSLR